MAWVNGFLGVHDGVSIRWLQLVGDSVAHRSAAVKRRPGQRQSCFASEKGLFASTMGCGRG
jgi:hypothetical protein